MYLAVPNALEALGHALRALQPVVDLPALWEQFFTREVNGGILYWQNAAIYVAGGLLFYALSARFAARSLRGAVRFLFPPELLELPSFRVDVQFFLADLLGFRHLLLLGASIVLLGNFYGPFVRALQLAALPGLSQISAFVHTLSGPAQASIAFVLALLGGELGFYAIHRASHRVPLLWAFHRVHHFSQQLNPFIVTRLHFLDEALQTQCGFVVGALAVSLLFPFEGQSISSLQGAYWALGAFMLLRRVSLRFTHSHIPISFGPWVDRVVVSPVVHEVHHSRDVLDRNFGNILSLWDTVFGTFYRPARGEEIRFGVSDAGDGHYRSFLHSTVAPFLEAVRLVREGRAFRQPPPPEPAPLVGPGA